MIIQKLARKKRRKFLEKITRHQAFRRGIRIGRARLKKRKTLRSREPRLVRCRIAPRSGATVLVRPSARCARDETYRDIQITYSHVDCVATGPTIIYNARPSAEHCTSLRCIPTQLDETLYINRHDNESSERSRARARI